jgi:hypothetical protein
MTLWQATRKTCSPDQLSPVIAIPVTAATSLAFWAFVWLVVAAFGFS